MLCVFFCWIIPLLNSGLHIYPCYIGVRSGMATFNLALPKITVEEFSRAWIWFELVFAAKEWSAEKQASILPMLLWGKPVEYYFDLDVTTKADLKLPRMQFMNKAGLVQDPLTAGKLFISCCQRLGEKAANFAHHFRKLFKQAYPKKDLTCGNIF